MELGFACDQCMQGVLSEQFDINFGDTKQKFNMHFLKALIVLSKQL